MIPTETKVALDKYHKEYKLMSEVERIFGKETGRYITGLSQGHMDTIVRLPLKPLARIMEYMGIKNLWRLAPVCKRFEEVSPASVVAALQNAVDRRKLVHTEGCSCWVR